ncbi:Pvc16 family protein [Lentzea aerocolonigenes]|uniref:Pvc16 family protein n=1 Tax=Lentzea aerocolonigenes TaxID=68170 RepID=UPI000696CE71|nr:Pvc16 family protein [Lentzea aerocolonigenes]
MIADLDATLEAVVLRAVPEGTRVGFDTPAPSWEDAGVTGPLVNMVLLEIEQHADGASAQPWQERRDGTGRLVERRAEGTQFAFTYLVSVWTGDRVTEHALLGALLAAFPPDVPEPLLVGAVRVGGVRVRVGSGGAHGPTWRSWGVRARACLALMVIARVPVLQPEELPAAVESVALAVASEVDTRRVPVPLPGEGWQRRRRGSVIEPPGGQQE